MNEWIAGVPPVDYWDTIHKGRELRVKRYCLFWWAIAHRQTVPAAWGYVDDQWRPLEVFWKRENAVAKLVELALRGYNVTL